MNRLFDTCNLTGFPKISDPRGNLTFIEGERHVPFAIRRVFYLYDVPAGADRGGHALRTCQQVLIAVAGSFTVRLDNGLERSEIRLSLPYQGLLIPPMVWREMDDFSSGAVCLVLASEGFNAADYYREYPEYLQALGAR